MEELSVRKAEAVFRTLSEDPVVVIGADTVVALDGEILGKPADEEDAFRMLRELSGRAHHVFTGVTLLGCIDGMRRSVLIFAPGRRWTKPEPTGSRGIL